jgi:hypothetical protein
LVLLYFDLLVLKVITVSSLVSYEFVLVVL